MNDLKFNEAATSFEAELSAAESSTLKAEMNAGDQTFATDLRVRDISVTKGEPGENGGYYAPSVKQTSENTVEISFSASKEDMEPVASKSISLPAGRDGAKGDKGDKGDKGETGEQGNPGKDGISPHVGSNGNWFIGENDTGIPATGPAGNQGLPGEAGVDGKDGTSATHSWNGTNLIVTSASGTSSANLKGDKGDKGDTGATGSQGPKGDKGDTGAAGKTAYQYAQDGGYSGTEGQFAKKLAEDMPDTLPNPHPLTINGKSYDGSEPVDLVITGGGASENILMGQTPLTLTKSANIRLVGEGEYSYTVKGKTIADLSTVDATYNNVILTKHDDHIELSITTPKQTEWHMHYAVLTVDGLTVGASYILAIDGYGMNAAEKYGNGYIQIRSSANADLGRISDDTTGIKKVTFTATTSKIDIRWYPAGSTAWGAGCEKAIIADMWLNNADDGADRTDVLNESGTFTGTYSLGTVSKGVTISTTPSCEVYAVYGGGGGSGEASAPLEGKTVVCFGDSLFGMYTGDSSAPAYVAKKTGATVHNVGFSGCRMSEHPYTSHNPFCMYALANAIASGDWSLQDAAADAASDDSNFPDQLAILKSIDFNAVDYIVIHYGTNDFYAGAGMVIDNPSNPKATDTFCGSFRHSVETLFGAFPKLKIFVSLPAFRFWPNGDGTAIYSDEKTNVKGNTLPEFVKALAGTAKEYNLPVIDCYYGLGINKSNAYTFIPMNDGTHHNPEGRKRFGEYIGAKLISEGDAGATGAKGDKGDKGNAGVGITAITIEEV